MRLKALTEFNICAAVLLITLLSTSRASELPEKMTISYFEHPQMPFFKALVEKSYKDIGIETEFINIDGERATRALGQGLVDADILQNDVFIERHADIVLIEPPLSGVVVFLICRKGVICERSVLEDKQQKVMAEKAVMEITYFKLNGLINAQLINMEKLDIQLQMLKIGRIDYVLYSAAEVLPDSLRLTTNSVELYTFNVHHALNKKFTYLAPLLENALSENLKKLSQNN